MSKSYRARLHPAQRAERFVIEGRIFFKERGWYAIEGEEFAKKLASVRENPLNPTASPYVFQVMEVSEAAAMERAEAMKIDPRGTVENPTLLPGSAQVEKEAPILTEEPDEMLEEPPVYGDLSAADLKPPKKAMVDEAPTAQPSPPSGGRVGRRKKVSAKK